MFISRRVIYETSLMYPSHYFANNKKNLNKTNKQKQTKKKPVTQPVSSKLIQNWKQLWVFVLLLLVQK